MQKPEKLSKYFATSGASGPLEEGKTVTWRWTDHPDVVGEVHVKKVVPNQLIVFEWKASEGGYNTRTEMKFEPIGDGETLVTISESGWKDTPEGLKSSYGNCWLEYGINLRKGAY